VDVYRNGSRLAAADYTATSGTTVVLASGATVGDTITTESFYVSSGLNAIPATAGAVNSTYLASGLTLTSPTLASPTMTGAVVSSMASSVITSGTAQASTSGTSINFTGIPSWVKRITVMFSGVSISSTSTIILQLGSGSFTTSGYTTSAANVTTSNANSINTVTAGMPVYPLGAAYLYTGSYTFVLLNASTNLWVASAVMGATANYFINSSGSIALSGALDRMRLTTVNGTDTFDAGSINILYE
jgi:hypothetical protein